MRARDESGNWSPLGTGVLIRTLPSPNTAPPEAVSDLHQVRADVSTILLAWTAPADDDGAPVERYRIRMALDGTAEPSVWPAGVELDDPPAPSSPGLIDSLRVIGLASGTRYGFVLRSVDDLGILSADSNILWAMTADPPPPPPMAPSAIWDLSLIEIGIDSALVAWTAPGDDGETGRASGYEVRLRRDAGIEDETDWASAHVPDTTGLGIPLPAGSGEIWVVRHLEAGTEYSLAIRAVDDSGLVAPLSNPLRWTTQAAPEPDPPAAVRELACAAQGVDWVELAWTAPASDPPHAQAARYLLAVRPGGRPIRSEADWIEASVWDDELSAPAGGERQGFRVTGLQPSHAYACAVRAKDTHGRAGEIGSSIIAFTYSSEEPDPPGADTPPAAVQDLSVTEVGSSWADIAWTAVGEDGLTGRADVYAVRVLTGAELATEADWQAAEQPEADLPVQVDAGERLACRLGALIPGEECGIAIRAIDRLGWASPLLSGPRIRVVPYLPSPPPLPGELAVDDLGEDFAIVKWRQTAGPEAPSGIASYSVAVSIAPLDLQMWDAAPKSPNPPSPAEEGGLVFHRCEGLYSGTEYWLTVRSRSPEGHVSTSLASIGFRTESIDLAPPDPPGGLRLAGLNEEGEWLLRFNPSPSPDVAGYFVYIRSSAGHWSKWNEIPLPPNSTEVLLPNSGEAYAISSIDRSGNEGGMSAPVTPQEAPLSLEGPFPHPVAGSCRFEISLPRGLHDQRLALRVFDARGLEVQRLFDGASGGSGTIRVAWDRRDSSGRTAAPGFYLVVLEAEGRQIRRQIFLSP